MLVEYIACLITRFAVGEDGRTPYGRLDGKKYRGELAELGEIVMYGTAEDKKGGLKKADPRFKEGVFLGGKRCQQRHHNRWHRNERNHSSTNNEESPRTGTVEHQQH